MKKQQIFFFIFLLVVNSVFAQKTKQQSTSSDVNAEIGTQLDLYNSLFRELNLYYVDTLNKACFASSFLISGKIQIELAPVLIM